MLAIGLIKTCLKVSICRRLVAMGALESVVLQPALAQAVHLVIRSMKQVSVAGLLAERLKSTLIAK